MILEICRVIITTGLLSCGQPMNADQIRDVDKELAKSYSTAATGLSAPFVITLPDGYAPPYPQYDRQPSPGTILHQGQYATCE